MTPFHRPRSDMVSSPQRAPGLPDARELRVSGASSAHGLLVRVLTRVRS